MTAPASRRVVLVDPLPERLRALYPNPMPDGIDFVCPGGPDLDEALALAAGADALITRKRPIDARLIAAAAGAPLRFIQVQGHLPDRVDLDAARAAGVPVAVMPSRGAIAVAEQAMALMLALARQIVPGDAGVRSAGYVARGLTPAVTTETSFAFNWLGSTSIFELNGRTLGLVGIGEIGQEVARRARAFGMAVLYTSRTGLAEPFERELGVRRVALDELLAASDVVSLHAPHTPETDRLLDARRLALLRPGACVINTARGGLVDEAALLAALESGRLGGAGLDVFAQEPLPSGHPFTTLSNVVLAPHVGGGAGGGQRGHARDTLENVARFLRGEPPRHRVA